MAKITNRNLLLLLFIASASALIFAYTAQYVFDYQPCILCFYQRKPFFVILALCSLTLTHFRSEKSKKIALYICTILLLINFGIASYHSGVEWKIFAGPTTCSSAEANSANSLEELKDILIKTKAVRCDEPELFFLGLSMANWNALYCLFLILYIAIIRYQRRSTLL